MKLKKKHQQQQENRVLFRYSPFVSQLVSCLFVCVWWWLFFFCALCECLSVCCVECMFLTSPYIDCFVLFFFELFFHLFLYFYFFFDMFGCRYELYVEIYLVLGRLISGLTVYKYFLVILGIFCYENLYLFVFIMFPLIL